MPPRALALLLALSSVLPAARAAQSPWSEKAYGVLLVGPDGGGDWKLFVDQVKKRLGKDVPLEAFAGPLEPKAARLLLRRASQTAGRMNTRWYAVYVRRRKDLPENLSAAEHRQLTETIQLGMSLGATVVVRESEDVVGTLLSFAREENVKILFVGSPSRRGVFGRPAPGIVSRLLDEADGLDVFVVDVKREAP